MSGVNHLLCRPSPLYTGAYQILCIQVLPSSVHTGVTYSLCIQVYDGMSAEDPLLGKFCNSGRPGPPLRTSSNVLYVRFFTDASIVLSGFNLTFQERDGKSCLYKFQCLASDFSDLFFSVKAWMLSKKLKLNDEKTEAMLVGSHQSTNLTKAESVQISGKKFP